MDQNCIPLSHWVEHFIHKYFIRDSTAPVKTSLEIYHSCVWELLLNLKYVKWLKGVDISESASTCACSRGTLDENSRHIFTYWDFIY